MILTQKGNQGSGFHILSDIISCIFISENNENTPLYGATQAMILAGHKDAKKRVLLFFSIYVITGTMSKLFEIMDA